MKVKLKFKISNIWEVEIEKGKPNTLIELKWQNENNQEIVAVFAYTPFYQNLLSWIKKFKNNEYTLFKQLDVKDNLIISFNHHKDDKFKLNCFGKSYLTTINEIALILRKLHQAVKDFANKYSKEDLTYLLNLEEKYGKI